MTPPPPKDKAFLADIGYQYYVLAQWSNVDNQYIFAEPQVDLYQGKRDDVHFQTGSFKEEELKGWIEVTKARR